MNTGELLNKLRDTMDAIDELNRAMSIARKERADIEAKLQRAAAESGVDSFANEVISVTVKESFIAAYDPDHWNDIIDYAARTGNYQIVQRRISTKPIEELIDNGSELPEGVRLEPVIRINARRK